MGLVEVLRLLGEMRKTGCLHLERGRWIADVWLERGRVVAANCGPEHGLDALDAAVLAMSGASFNFSEMADLPAIHNELSLNARQVASHAAQLPGRRLVTTLVDPASVPRVRQREEEQQTAARLSWASQGPPPPVVLEPPTLRLLLALDGKRTVAQLVERFGLTRTIKGLATLADLGLVSLPESPAPPGSGMTKDREAKEHPNDAADRRSSESQMRAGVDGRAVDVGGSVASSLQWRLNHLPGPAAG